VLIDTHAHLDDARYDADREAVMARAREAGVGAFITIGCDLATSRAAVELAARHPGVYAAVGVHPHEVKHIEDGWYDELRRLARHEKVVAYGEIGLDYHYNHSPPKLQRERFREQIGLARELHLPVIVHTREALALGFYLSFSGVLTFRNAAPLQAIAQTVPLDRLLVETDCPYLTPAPHRGQRNEPAFVKLVAEKIAEVRASGKSLTVEEIGRITSDNARRLFKIP